MSKQLPQREYDRAKTDRIIAKEMVIRSMSDATWVRLLTALSENIDQSISILVKLVWDNEPRTMWIRGAQLNFDYYASAIEAMIGGFPRGWYDFNEIEWIAFSEPDDHLHTLNQQLDSVGMFDLKSCGPALGLTHTVVPQMKQRTIRSTE